jgi:CBS domain-containing protein
MAQTVADVMTRNPASVERGETAAEAARLMARGDLGEVIVLDNGDLAIERDEQSALAGISAAEGNT